jgi:pyridoxine kinase
MARVLAISSQTVFGPVGNSAAVPALQELGHEVMALPTVVLSNHPGHGAPKGQQTSAPLLEDMLAALEGVGAFQGLAAVMTGYFATSSQVIAVTKQIALFQKEVESLQVLVDPVIGDHGALYVPQDVAETIRDHLLPLATISTPNLFELGWLSGTPNIDAALQKLAVPETVVTSIPRGQTELETRLYADGTMQSHRSPRLENVPHGTGDFLAGAYLARRVANPPRASFEGAMRRLGSAIEKSAGKSALDVSRP